jgi:DNA replicative helicase MCM subunit Mcm2 (Cdc46/Mcm family)
LIKITGIIIGASTLSAKATVVHLMCRGCRHVKTIPVTSGFAGIQFPRVCDGFVNILISIEDDESFAFNSYLHVLMASLSFSL